MRTIFLLLLTTITFFAKAQKISGVIKDENGSSLNGTTIRESNQKYLESVMQFAAYLDLSNSESPEFTGRVIAALAADPDVSRLSGQWLVVAALAASYGIADIDGRQPRPLTLEQV